MRTATATHWLERSCWLGASLAGLTLCLSLLHAPVGVLPLLLFAFVVIAAVLPWAALLVVTAASPLVLVVAAHLDLGAGARLEEAVVLAFIAGAGAHFAWRRRPGTLPGAFTWGAWLLILTAIASGAVVLAGDAGAHPETGAWPYVWTLLSSRYLREPNALTAAMLIAEGLLLALLCAQLCARDPGRRSAHLVRVAVAAGAAVGGLTALRLISVAFARENPMTALGTLLTEFRISVVQPDVNAAGSYFALILCAAWSLPGSTGLRFISIALTILGLWASGSRAAFAALGLVTLVSLMVRARVRVDRRAAVAGAVLLIVSLMAIAVVYPVDRNEGLRAALLYRTQLARAALYAVGEAPVFGIGPGRFYHESFRYVGASRPADTPLHVAGPENAHNNFLQIAAELGLPGLALFLIVVVAALGRPPDGLRYSRARMALVAGILAYLVTCLFGHPLLMAATAYPFWIILGVVAAGARVEPVRQPVRLVAIAVGVVVLASVPPRVLSAIRAANLEHAGVGVSMWQRDDEGLRFRWAGGRSAVYVPTAAAAVRIPLRHGGAGPDVIEVRIFVEGREANRVLVQSGADWTPVRLFIPDRFEASFIKVELVATVPGTDQPLEVEPTQRSGALMIGRVETEGTRQ